MSESRKVSFGLTEFVLVFFLLVMLSSGVTQLARGLGRIANALEEANAHSTLVEIELQRIANAQDRLVTQGTKKP